MAYKKINSNRVELDEFPSSAQNQDLQYFIGVERNDEDKTFNEVYGEYNRTIYSLVDSWCKITLTRRDNTALNINIKLEENISEEPRSTAIKFYNEFYDKDNEEIPQLIVKQKAAFYPYLYFRNDLQSTYQYVDNTQNIQQNNEVINIAQILTRSSINETEIFRFAFGKKNKTNWVTNITGFQIVGTLNDVDLNTYLKFSVNNKILSLCVYNKDIYKIDEDSTSQAKILYTMNQNRYTLNVTIKITEPVETDLYFLLESSIRGISNNSGGNFNNNELILVCLYQKPTITNNSININSLNSGWYYTIDITPRNYFNEVEFFDKNNNKVNTKIANQPEYENIYDCGISLSKNEFQSIKGIYYGKLTPQNVFEIQNQHYKKDRWEIDTTNTTAYSIMQGSLLNANIENKFRCGYLVNDVNNILYQLRNS